MESFCDIFGTMIESTFDSQNADYEIGGQTCIHARSMQNPKQTGLFQSPCPDYYNGQYWNGEKHNIAGVQNRWFYLLSEGGSGVNERGDHYVVSGIGKTNAAKIAYKNLVNYLSSQSNYTDAYNGSVQSAIDIFGSCSFEVEQTVRAWNAVGVSGYINYDYHIDVLAGPYYFTPPSYIRGIHAVIWERNGASSTCILDDGKVIL